MKIFPLDKAKKKKFLAGILDLGMKKIPQLLIKTGKESIRAYSGNLSTEEVWDIWRLLPIEGIGLYIGKEMINQHGVREIRLSLDGLHTWKDQITERIITLTEEQEENWFKGKNIELDSNEGLTGFVAVQSADKKDFIGTGKISNDGKTLFSFLPKERRRKSSSI
ncbi:MAG: tRNA pseudouridine(55) synthase TruB [archaeon]|nr:tRNA pseudouridine(55) synthase TruB [archaeon]MCR4323418.1 tRNA pseudouridine(55) synthase TruB [Nanoarchaeota archaeon]